MSMLITGASDSEMSQRIEEQQQMPVAERFAGEGRRSEAGALDADPQFLLQLATQSRLG